MDDVGAFIYSIVINFNTQMVKCNKHSTAVYVNPFEYRLFHLGNRLVCRRRKKISS